MGKWAGLNSFERGAQIQRVLGYLLGALGGVFSIFVFIYDDKIFALVLAVLSFAVALLLPYLSRTQVARRRDQIAAFEAEAQKMQLLKNSMTPVEWENYKLKLENNLLLGEIAKRGRNTYRGPTVGMGVISDFPDSGD